MKPEQKPSVSLKPVRTREDCMDWLTEEQVGAEVWAAFRGARRYFEERDWELECSVVDVERGGGHGLVPGTVLDKFDGQPFATRDEFASDVLQFVLIRLAALCERYGVDPCLGAGSEWLPVGCRTAQQALNWPAFAPYLGGEVRTFKSKREMEAWMKAKAQQKKAPAGVSSTPEAMTNVKGANADGTHCRP